MSPSIALRLLCAASIAVTLSSSAQTPILRYDFEGASGTAVPNVANGSTYNGTSGSGVSFGSTASFGVTPSSGGYSYVDPTTFTLTPGYSLTGLGSQVAHFTTATAGGTDANDRIAIGDTVNATSMFANAPGVTLSGWFIQNTTNTASQTLFYITRNSANSSRLQIALDGGSGTDTYYGNVNAQYRNSGLQNNVSPSGGITPGLWTFVTVSLSYSTSGDTFSIYLNGQLAASGTMPGTDAGGVYPNEVSTSGAFIGAQSNGGGALDGYLDDVNVYNSALSASDVATLYNSYLSVPEPNTLSLGGLGILVLLFRLRSRKAR